MELLVVVVILAILGGMVSGALIVARSSAREAATRATIAKLHNIIMAKYESYRTRRVPLSDQEMHRIAVQYYGLPAAQPLPTRLGALIRLRALRDIMRMEMPDRWTDVLNGSTVLIPAPDPSNPWIPDTSMPPDPPTPMLRPSLSQSYYTRFRSVWFPFYSAENGKNVDEQTGLRRLHEHAPAECLYMFITAAGGEDARRQFRASEIGDTDGDGFPEFLDGWGRPIFFLRWAPAFNDSDFQPDVVDQTDLYATSPGDEVQAWTKSNTMARRQAAAEADHDPFDSRRVDMAISGEIPFVPRGSRLVPLVYSAGPDGRYGIYNYPKDDPATQTVSESWEWRWSEHPTTNNALSAYAAGFGLPMRSDDGWVHFDNIHNHMSLTEAR